MSGFSGVENETAVGLELKSTTPWTQSLSDVTMSAVRVRLSVPSLQ
jgi:predicted phage tail protein